jgi:hypothetical protein
LFQDGAKLTDLVLVVGSQNERSHARN